MLVEYDFLMIIILSFIGQRLFTNFKIRHVLMFEVKIFLYWIY